MSKIEKSIDVDVPVRTAYNQWTQFEEFPKFMEGVENVGRSTSAACTGKPRSPERRSNGTPRSPSRSPTSGSPGAARRVPSSRRRDVPPAVRSRCRVKLQLDYEPKGLGETVGDWLGGVSGRSRATSSVSRSSSRSAA